MPTINFSLKDLSNLVGKKLTINQVSELVEYGKGELEDYDKENDEVTVNFEDTNLPFLWSTEGVARLIKGVLGLEKGIPKLKINKADYKVIVDRSVSAVRPYIAAFVAKGHKIDDYLIKQMVQLQEKVCESFGRRRQKVAIGVYSYDKIKFPIHYKATDPESVKFVPLEFKKKMTQQEILEEHPKGKDYAWILKDSKKYPLLVDDANEVLSFPPIINSNFTGKIQEGDEHLFVEATGTDLKALLLSMNIFAQAFYERGFEIYSVIIKYPNKTIVTPYVSNDSIKIKKEQVKSLLGLDLKETEIKKLVEKAQYNFSNFTVKIPCYRSDILHPYDVIEDIGIMYGYNKIDEKPLKSYTIGETKPIIDFIDKAREIIIGLGYQEILSPILTNKNSLFEKMNVKEFGSVDIKNYVSETYSASRNWLIPTLLEVISKNKHVGYPQKIFEQGTIVTRKDKVINEFERIAAVSAHEKADYTEIKQALDYLLRMLNVKYKIEETEHDSFITGRVGRVIVNGKKVAYIGEINPQVLSNWEIEVPVAAFELNLTDLFSCI